MFNIHKNDVLYNFLVDFYIFKCYYIADGFR